LSTLLQKPIEYLKGVGPQRGDMLKKELQIFTCGDLLSHYPYRYIDRSRIYKIEEIQNDEAYIQVKGIIRNIQEVGQQRGKRLTAILSDDTGNIELVWFQGAQWVKKALKPNAEYLVFCKPSYFNNRLNLVHPELELVAEERGEVIKGLQPMYPSTEKLKAKGLDSKGILKLTTTLMQEITAQDTEEFLPAYVFEKYKFISRHETLKNIHYPENEIVLQKARGRLKFDELFLIQLKLLAQKLRRKAVVKGFIFSKANDNNLRQLYKKLIAQNFILTKDQLSVLEEVRNDVSFGKQMNRLVQGDVGSGKTIVALLAMLMGVDNGFQACLMAPTEILAQQHFETISTYLEGLSVNVQLLTGSVKGTARKKILENILSGETQILIGTHALIEETVQFKNIGLVVIDEQHRFGVEQRSKLWEKNETPPHILVMTATPIPRTLAMTLYGDLDVSAIRTMPPGRMPIATAWMTDAQRLRIFQLMKDEIAKGRQVYVVYPLIEESEKMDYKDLMDGYESISRAFPIPQYQVSVVHGRMKAADKDFEMNRFAKGETHIMVATTVIEVGVNVPNASMMVIESAERFGLSQLHQLRGRVGRGIHQSYCILVTGNKLSADGKKRMQTMVHTNDGFEIAEVDMQLRGPGDMQGTSQSGHLNLRIADITKDQKILQEARNTAEEILDKDAQLQLPDNFRLRQHISNLKSEMKKWSRIS
jgi:ATP-dependent DNA helicase RecG